MGASISYARPKSATTNTTAIAFTIKAGESDEDPLPATSGATGIVTVEYSADADESGGTDVQKIATFTITPSMSATGQLSFVVGMVPTDGAAADGTCVPTITADGKASFSHPQSMDAWQTAAGRARQA